MGTIQLTAKQFTDISKLIYHESGINIHHGKMELLKSKIAKRMRMTGIRDSNAYISRLKSDRVEVSEFIDTVTTNHSFFFRENKSIEYVVDQLHTTAAQKPHKTFSIWCAASSTGDEPYSVAMQLLDRGIPFAMRATDISHSVLAQAVKGVYPMKRLQGVPEKFLRRYCQKGTGKNSGYVRMKPEVKQHISFQKFNLITDTPPSQKFDVILCRNVMIYFDPATTEKVVNRLYQSLEKGGFFTIGQSESLMNMNHGFTSIRNVPSTFIKP